VKTIRIGQDVYNYLLAHGMGAGESASAVLRRELTRTIEIDDELHTYILSLAVEIGESASDILRRELKLGEPPSPGGPTDPTRIEFRIPAGTGSGAWNTHEHPVAGTVGQMLRIFNDDTVPHRLHTSGVPFPHAAADILPGQSGDFVLQTPFEPTTQSTLYDHNFGPGARFWITVRPVT
jgi:predicted CopG family antitoxin